MMFDADDRARTEMRAALMRTLARGVAGEMWQEIGRDVADGVLDLRDAARSGAYRHMFAEAARELASHRAEIGETAFDREGRQAAEVVAELRRGGST
ncbi:hypothetical protein [Dactylosporangium sp. CA-139066]|uniref:hypothetical protein n=1 Tax=Dactylosporangium sp. CA-139066 TaxID=3239930 RepID=UPI003D94E27F